MLGLTLSSIVALVTGSFQPMVRLHIVASASYIPMQLNPVTHTAARRGCAVPRCNSPHRIIPAVLLLPPAVSGILEQRAAMSRQLSRRQQQPKQQPQVPRRVHPCQPQGPPLCPAQAHLHLLTPRSRRGSHLLLSCCNMG